MNWLFVIFLVLGLVAVGFVLRSLKRASDSRNWPSTNGVVLSSDVHTTYDHSDEDSSVKYRAKVVYSYQVAGQEYQAERVRALEGSSNSSRRARANAAKYPQGEAVRVYYHPQKPDQCLLEPGIKPGDFLALGVTLVFVVIGVLGLLGVIG